VQLAGCVCVGCVCLGLEPREGLLSCVRQCEPQVPRLLQVAMRVWLLCLPCFCHHII
jgi:hypothetical protein